MKKVGELFPLCLIDRIIDKINTRCVKKSLIEIGSFCREVGHLSNIYRIYLNHPALNLFTIAEIKYYNFDKDCMQCSVCFIAENARDIKGMEEDMYDEFVKLLLDICSGILTPDNINYNLTKGISVGLSECIIYTGYSPEYNGNLIFSINQYKCNCNI